MCKLQVAFLVFAFVPLALSKDLPEAFRAKLLNDIQPNFEENLRRAFNNEGIRQQKLQKDTALRFVDAAYSRDNNYMSMKNAHLSPIPELRVKEFKVDLANAAIDISLNLGNLTFDVDLELVNDTIFTGMHNVSNNHMRILMSSVTVLVNVGFAPIEDSFVPKNYHVNAQLEDITANVDQKELGAMQTVLFLSKEFSPSSIFMVQLTGKMHEKIHKQLGAILVEYSVNELLLDEEDEIRDYKDYLRKRVLKANSIVDNLVNTAKSRGLLKDIELPTDIMLPYKQETSSRRSKLIGSGTIKGVANLTRTQDWSLLETGASVQAFGFLSIKDFKFTYDYETEYLDNKIQGRITATVYKNKFNIMLTTSKRTCKQDVEIICSELSDIEIDISGLGGLSWLQPKIKDIVIGTIHVDTRYIVDRYLEAQLAAVHRDSTCSTL